MARRGTTSATDHYSKKNKKDGARTTLETTEGGDTDNLNIVVGEEESNWADVDYGSED